MTAKEIETCLNNTAGILEQNKAIVTIEVLTAAKELLEMFRRHLDTPANHLALSGSLATRLKTNQESAAMLTTSVVDILKKIIDIEMSLISGDTTENMATLARRLAARKILLRAVAWFV